MKNLLLIFICLNFFPVFGQNIGERKEVKAVSLGVKASWSGSFPNYKRGKKKDEAIYNPPPGWVIVTHRVRKVSESNGDYSVSTLAQGLNYTSETVLNEVYKSLLDLAAQKNDAEKYKARIQDDYKSHLNELRRIQTNKNTLLVKVKAEADGNEADRKRGWIEIVVYATIEYVGHASKEELLTRLKAKYEL